jgi:hypothetical protein
VARALSSQKPGESVSCLSLFILVSLLATSKKPPQDQHTVSHILQLFCCHPAKLRVIFKSANELIATFPGTFNNPDYHYWHSIVHFKIIYPAPKFANLLNFNALSKRKMWKQLYMYKTILTGIACLQFFFNGYFIIPGSG